MAHGTRLSDEEKQNGKRKLLIPSEEIQELMQPITREEFAGLVKKAIPPSRVPDRATS